jgi:hypothetical protein
MSDFRSIGGVSATLQTLLRDRMELPDGTAAVLVTVGPPAFSAGDNNPHDEDERVNLFLYRVTENGYLQNQEIPGRDSRGAYGHPPLSLNLHYLITAYGNLSVQAEAKIFDETKAQFLLGSAMRALHDTPVVTDQLLTLRPPSGRTVLHESLRDEYEQIKITLEPLTLDDITKVWSSLTLRFRLSAAYVVNVVQIESRRTRTFPRLVGRPASAHMPLPTEPPTPGPMIYTLTIQTPTVTNLSVRRPLEAAEQPFPYARIGDTLILRGTSLAGPVVEVDINDLRIPASFATGDRVEAVIPDEAQLQPGVRTARIVVSDPVVPHHVTTSNDSAFMLVPGVNAAPAYAAGPPRIVTIGGTRLVRQGASGETVIGRSAVPGSAYAAASPNQIVVPIPDTLPARDVPVFVTQPLIDPVTFNGGPYKLDVTIGGITGTSDTKLPQRTVPLDDLPTMLAALIHDAAPTVAGHPDQRDARFTGATVSLWQNQLIVVTGGLRDAIAFASPAGATFAAVMGLTQAQSPAEGSALLSGEIASPPVLSSPNPRLMLTVGARPPVTVAIPPANSLAALAQALQAAVRAAAGGIPAYANALAIAFGSRLIFVPGEAGRVSFDPAPGDDSTVAELQLHAKFAVRVRVNGSESIDPAFVELPQ